MSNKYQIITILVDKNVQTIYVKHITDIIVFSYHNKIMLKLKNTGESTNFAPFVCL